MLKKNILPCCLAALLVLGCSQSSDRTRLNAYDSENFQPAELDEEVFLNEVEDVRIIVEDHQTVEEYRHRGQLVLIKVIPKGGLAYYIDPMHNQRIPQSSQDLIDSGVKPVYWVIKEF
ncbi:DUF2782 domain-containing protein [Marinicella sp. W31]|uniref:DUF2782 domain-containing protein n=1 Tax=Marinicella sp. W31 TaxID=3023713 RepID=UPI003757435C